MIAVHVSKALLVHGGSEPFKELAGMLKSSNMPFEEVQTIKAAIAKLDNECPPEVIFTESRVPDGACTELVRLARQSANAAAVVVVGPFAGVSLYPDAPEQGGFYSLTPPFEFAHLAMLLQRASRQTMAWRQNHFADVLRSLQATV